MRAVVVVLGNDRPGIIYHVSKILYEKNANIVDIDQTVLQNEIFTMVMLVDLENINCDFAVLKEDLNNLGNSIGVSIRIQQEDIFNAMHSI